MAEHILAALPNESFSHCLMVAADEGLLELAGRYGISGVINNRPDLGIARSIRMGLAGLPPADACMFCVCDQPLLERGTIAGMASSYPAGSIYVLESHGKRGNPVIFPAALFSELAGLPAGGSGKTVVSAHPDLLKTYKITDKAQLLDADTRCQFERIESLIFSRTGQSL